VLRRYVDTRLAQANPTSSTYQPNPTQGVAWLMGMLTTKDHREVFEALLRPGDSLYLVPVPEHLSATPEDLAAIAQSVCPDLSHCGTYADLHQGLTALASDPASLKVFCGSLYLIGHFFATEAQAT
jgi:dihydrofolate synthase/folylpolyglutamate synthase